LPLRNIHKLERDLERLKRNSLSSSGEESWENFLENEMEKVKKVFYQKGFEEGKRKAETSILILKELLKQAVEKLEVEKQNFLKKSEKQLIEMALAISKKIIRKEVSVDQEIIRKIAREALQRVVNSGSEKVVMRISPRDWESIMQIHQELLFPDKSGSEIKIEKDENIQPGGCIVETERGLVNASIEHQLEQIGKALMEEEE
jgi:flagellar assembly protein FliH